MNQLLTPTFDNRLETFGSRLEFIRQNHLLSIKSMASSVGVSPATWRNYEKDKTYPSENTLWNFCGIYHVNREWLDSYEGVPYADGYKPGDPLGKPRDYVETMVQAMESMFQDLFKIEAHVDKAIELTEDLLEMEDEVTPDDPDDGLNQREELNQSDGLNQSDRLNQREGLSKIVDGLVKLQSQVAVLSDSMDSDTLEMAEHYLDLAIESVIDVMDENGWIEF